MCSMPTWAMPSSSQLGKGMQTILIAERDESRPYDKRTISKAERDESRPYDKTRISINKNKKMKKRNYTFPQSFIAGFLLLVGGLVVSHRREYVDAAQLNLVLFLIISLRVSLWLHESGEEAFTLPIDVDHHVPA